MKRIFPTMLFVFTLMLIAGCARHYVVDRDEMYLAPSLTETPEKITVIAFALNPIMDLAEGGDGRFSWKTVMWDKAVKEQSYLALSLNYPEAKTKVLLAVIPQPLAEVEGNLVGVFDHGGKKVYNQLGEYCQLESLGKLDMKKYEKCLFMIKSNEPNVKEVVRGSDDYANLVKLYYDFRIQEIKTTQKYVYQKYGSNLSQKELQKIADEDSVVKSTVKWLGEGWYVYFSYPFMGVKKIAIQAAIMKLFSIPSIWGDKINKPGYMEYVGDSEHNAKMILRAIRDYSGK